jgi:hypothetical protein
MKEPEGNRHRMVAHSKLSYEKKSMFALKETWVLLEGTV